MKMELTIKADYMSKWGVWEGIRELIQNGRDAEVEQNAPLTVKHRKETNTLVIENEGCTLPHEALLLGHTSKTDRADLIGKFGEGLKLGILALVRFGCAVKIRSGSEVWIPSIQRSEKFNADVLVFDVQGGRKAENRVSIEIGSIGEGAWNDMKVLFLFLRGSVTEKERVETDEGSLLLAERFRGRVYVKGIFVAMYVTLAFGYDFSDADIDRDRRMLASYEMDYRTRLIWRSALATRPDLVPSFQTLLDQNGRDVQGWENTYTVDETLSTAVVETFHTRHGADAVPVATLAESAEIEHLGKKGVICPGALRNILQKKLGTLESIKEALSTEGLKTYSWHELNDIERLHLTWSVRQIAMHVPLTLDDIEVQDFRDPNLYGMFKDGKVFLAKKNLADQFATLRVLVHEVSHRGGADGEKSHVSNIETLWCSVAQSLFQNLDDHT